MGAPSRRRRPAESGDPEGTDARDDGAPRRPAEPASARRGGPGRPGPDIRRSRYFIALRPSARARRSLGALAASLARRFGGRPLAAEDIHLTLAFIGEAPESIEAPLCESIAPLASPGALAFDRLDHFGPRLLWIGPQSQAPWLETMARTLRAELDRLGVAYDRKRFNAHATLVRGARTIDPAGLEAAREALAPIAAGRMQVSVGASAEPGAPKRYRWIG